MRFLSFDVGIINLAYVLADAESDNLRDMHIIALDCVNITHMIHNRVSKVDCQLFHTKEAHDRLAHFLQEAEPGWGHIDQVYVERQPLTGLTNIESLLFQHFRCKIVKVSPNAMHHQFSISHLNYDQRKEATTRMATPYLQSFPVFNDTVRKHDIADAFMLLKFVLEKQATLKEKTEKEAERKAIQEELFQRCHNMGMDDYFNTFRHKIKGEL
jgi:hypothetical protein